MVTFVSQSPLFSVVIPTYNRANMLRQTLQSVFRQEYRDFEVFVVDDGSTEDQLPVIAEFRDRVTFLRQKNAGPGVARNRGAEAARGDYLAFLDSDDLWFPWTLTVLARFIQEHNRPAVLAGRLFEFLDEAELLGIHQLAVQAASFTDYYASSQRGYFVGAGASVLRREEFLKTGGFRSGFMNAEDHDLIMRMGAAAGFVQVLSPVTIAWRRHANSATANFRRTYEGMRYLLRQERRHAYPGGRERLRDRRRILLTHLRPTALSCVRHGLKREAWELYRVTYRWHLALGRWRFLLGFPLIAVLNPADRILFAGKQQPKSA